MYEFYKGYIVTKGKVPVESIKNRNNYKTLGEVEHEDSYAGVLNKNTILIDIDDGGEAKIMFKIVDALQLNCRVYKTKRGMHFVFVNTDVEKCFTHTKLAIGLTADIKVGCKTSIEVLKCNGVEREIIYDIQNNEEYDYLPKFLRPVKSNVDFAGMGDGDGRNQAFFNYILTLQKAGFNTDECKEVLSLINTYVISKPLSDAEMAIITRDEAFQKPVFYEGKTFLFDRFAHYLMNQYHIIKIDGRLHVYDNGVYVDAENKIERKMIECIPTLTSANRTEVLKYLYVLIDDDTPVSDARYILFKNGVYDLLGETLLPLSEDFVFTNKIDYNYNPDAYSEVVDKTLDKLACNNRDIRYLLEEVIGYTFYRRNELRKAFILTGEKSNGKSTYFNMLSKMLGYKNTSALDLSQLGDKFSTASLFNKLANIGDDIGDDYIDSGTAAILKKVVSGDRVKGEFKGEREFFFKPYCKILLSANDIPRIGKGSNSDAIIDRLVIIPFNAKFSKDDADYNPTIIDDLTTDESIEYIINLGVEALKDVLYSNKFTTCVEVDEMLCEYEINNNPFLDYVSCFPLKNLENHSTSDCYLQYTTFCATNGYKATNKQTYSKEVAKHYGLVPKVVWRGDIKKSVKIFVLE